MAISMINSDKLTGSHDDLYLGVSLWDTWSAFIQSKEPV